MLPFFYKYNKRKFYELNEQRKRTHLRGSKPKRIYLIDERAEER